MIWNALTHMIKIKIFTHLVHYRLFGENDFCWQWWDDPFRPISYIYGQLFISLIAEHAQLKSSSDNHAFVHVHNKNVITLHWKKSLVVMINHPSFQIYLLWFFFSFSIFPKKSIFIRERHMLMTMFLHKDTEAVKLPSKPPIHVTTNKQMNEWTNKQTNE